LYDGDVVNDRTVPGVAGTSLGNLKVAFVDESGEDVSHAMDSYLGSNAITVSWGKAETGGSKGGGKKNSKNKSKAVFPNFELPDVEVPHPSDPV
jgi:hypothetical protein